MDSVVLYGPGGASPIQLGSYIQADPGPDYGEKGHIEPHFDETPAVAGGQTLYTQTHIRKMTLPLMLASYGVSLRSLESLIRLNAVQGGYIDVQPFSVPSAEAVRFDILAGQWEPDFRIRINELGRSQGNLMLQTQPYGYWPTWITLGSAASIGMPGFLPATAVARVGDVAGYGELIVSPTVVGSQYVWGSMMPDVVLWSLRTQPSFQPFLSAASWQQDLIAGFGYSASMGGPAATGVTLNQSPSGAWTRAAYYTLSQALEPNYRGRFQAYALARVVAVQGALQNVPAFNISLDAVSDAAGGAPLASAAAIASLSAQLIASNGEQLIPLGRISLPPIASGLSQAVRLRLWAQEYAGLGLEFGGIYLLPADQPAGVLTKALTVPSTHLGSTGRFALDSYERSAFVGAPTGTLDQRLPISPVPNYRGALPVVGSSMYGVDLLGLARIGGYGWGYRAEVLADAPDYFYTFQASSFPTMFDWSGNGHIGTWGPLGGVLGVAPTGIRIGYDDLAVYASAPQSSPTGQGFIMGSYGPVGSFSPVQPYWSYAWTVEFWAAPQTVGIPLNLQAGAVLSNAVGPSVATHGGWTIGFNAPTILSTYGLIFDLGNDLLSATIPPANLTAGAAGKPMHVVAQWYSPSRAMALYVNGSLVGSKVVAGTYISAAAASGIGVLGYLGSAVGGYRGVFDELAVYPTILSASRIAAHYAAGASGILSTATDNMLYTPMSAQATIRYRPAFSFLKGL